MRTVRGILLAIVATIALAGGLTSTADAGTLRERLAPAAVDPGDGGSGHDSDPGDPGLPPD